MSCHFFLFWLALAPAALRCPALAASSLAPLPHSPEACSCCTKGSLPLMGANCKQGCGGGTSVRAVDGVVLK